MKALCLVAHPDDCVIFGYSYIYTHIEHDWTIGYLTYTAQDSRGAELAAFWRTRGIDCVFLGHNDDYHDLETKKISFDTAKAAAEIKHMIQQYDLVLTHDERGDYGHLHHVFVHDCAQDHPGLVKFAGLSMGTVSHTVPAGTYNLSELPLHGEIVQKFFPDGQHRNNYTEVFK
jgi:LmbE family N-acetylglucosaminyl deacetylase